MLRRQTSLNFVIKQTGLICVRRMQSSCCLDVFNGLKESVADLTALRLEVLDGVAVPPPAEPESGIADLDDGTELPF